MTRTSVPHRTSGPPRVASHDPPTVPGIERSGEQVKKTVRGWFSRWLEPQFLFPALALAVVGIVWGTTLAYLRTLRMESERSAQVSTRDNVETYEAQVVRALDQVNQALNVVTYWQSQPGTRRTLADLRDHDLLPPDLLFIVSIVDRNGVI